MTTADEEPTMLTTFRAKHLPLVGVLVLTACTTIQTSTPEGQSVTMTEAEFSAYVERVFRHHNKVYNELMDGPDSEDEAEDGGATPKLLNAEEDMIHVCLPLNEVVAATVGGSQPSLKSKWQLLSAVPACEAATRRVEALIPDTLRHE
jgi:hypothetical protein